MPRSADNPRWSDPGLLVLGSLAGGAKHGLAILHDLQQNGDTRLGPGTLYGVIARLENRGLIERLDDDDARRRTYRLTTDGARVLLEQLASMKRFAAQSSAASSRSCTTDGLEARMSTNRINKAVLASYPRRFRERYGQELLAAAEVSEKGVRTTADLVRASLSAWFFPRVGTRAEQRRDRLQSRVAGFFFVWCAFVCAGAMFAKAVDDQPVPGLRSWGWLGFSIARGVFESTAAIVMVTGFVYWLYIVVPAVRARRRDVLVPALLPAPIVGTWLVASELLALYARHLTNGLQLGVLSLFLLAGYVVVTGICVFGCALSALRTLDVADLSERTLVPAIVLLFGASVAFAVQTVASAVALARVFAVGEIGSWIRVTAVVPVVVMVVATAIGLVASAYGISDFRQVLNPSKV